MQASELQKHIETLKVRAIIWLYPAAAYSRKTVPHAVGHDPQLSCCTLSCSDLEAVTAVGVRVLQQHIFQQWCHANLLHGLASGVAVLATTITDSCTCSSSSSSSGTSCAVLHAAGSSAANSAPAPERLFAPIYPCTHQHAHHWHLWASSLLRSRRHSRNCLASSIDLN